MAPPIFLSSSFAYFNRQGVSDAQAIIDDIDTRLLAHNPAWTKPSAGLYKSPVDAANRFFDVLLTKINAQKLEMRVRDYNSVTLCTRRINAPATNLWDVHLLYGENHLEIWVNTGTTAPEFLSAGLLDCSPDAQNSHTHNVYGNGARTTLDAVYSYISIAYAAMVDNVTVNDNSQRTQGYNPASYGDQCLLTMNGSRMYREAAYYALPTGDAANFRLAGRRYHTFVTDAGLAPFARVTVPIDFGVAATFMVSPQPLYMSSRFCMRIA